MSDNLKIFRTMQVRKWLPVLLAALLTGCATTSPYDGQSVAVAAEQGNLEAMYTEVDQALQRASPGSERHASLTLVRDDLVARLSEQPLEEIGALMTAAKDGPLPLPELDRLDAEIATLGQWQAEPARELAAQAIALRDVTGQEIVGLETSLGEMPASQVGQRYVATMRLAHLQGGDSGEQLRQQAATELADTYQAGLSAVQRKQLPEAQLLLDEVAYAEPDYREVADYQAVVATGLFEQNFWQALVDGRPEDAFAVFYDFVRTPAFEAHRSQIALDAGDLAEYYDALGDTARGEGKWLQSYQAYRKASFVRTSLRLPLTPSTGLKRFLAEIERRYQAADRRGEQAAAFAYLSVIESLYPRHALLGEQKAARERALGMRAAVSLSVETFAGEQGPDVSDELRRRLGASAARQFHLVDELGVVADDDRGGRRYIVRGQIADADVQTQSYERSVSRSVAVGSEPGANPAYAEWKRLPRSERSKVTEPPKAANLPVYEYVSLTYIDVASEAELRVDFYLIDPATDSERRGDQVAVRSIAEGTGIAPSTRGEFVQPAVAADIPPAEAQLRALAGEASARITDQLSEWFVELDRYYVDRAVVLSENSKDAEAVEAWVFAYLVSDPAEDKHAGLRIAMEEAVISL